MMDVVVFREMAGLMSSLGPGTHPMIDRLSQTPQALCPLHRQRLGRNMQNEVITRISAETGNPIVVFGDRIATYSLSPMKSYEDSVAYVTS